MSSNKFLSFPSFVAILIMVCMAMIGVDTAVQEILTNLGAERHRATDILFFPALTTIGTPYKHFTYQDHNRNPLEPQAKYCKISLKVPLLNDTMSSRSLCLFKPKPDMSVFDQDLRISLDGVDVGIEEFYRDLDPVVGFVMNEPSSYVQGYMLKKRFYGTIRLYDKYRLYQVAFYVEPLANVNLYSPGQSVSVQKGLQNAVLFEYVATVQGSKWISLADPHNHTESETITTKTAIVMPPTRVPPTKPYYTSKPVATTGTDVAAITVPPEITTILNRTESIVAETTTTGLATDNDENIVTGKTCSGFLYPSQLGLSTDRMETGTTDDCTFATQTMVVFPSSTREMNDSSEILNPTEKTFYPDLPHTFIPSTDVMSESMSASTPDPTQSAAAVETSDDWDEGETTLGTPNMLFVASTERTRLTTSVLTIVHSTQPTGEDATMDMESPEPPKAKSRQFLHPTAEATTKEINGMVSGANDSREPPFPSPKNYSAQTLDPHKNLMPTTTVRIPKDQHLNFADDNQSVPATPRHTTNMLALISSPKQPETLKPVYVILPIPSILVPVNHSLHSVISQNPSIFIPANISPHPFESNLQTTRRKTQPSALVTMKPHLDVVQPQMPKPVPAATTRPSQPIIQPPVMAVAQKEQFLPPVHSTEGYDHQPYHSSQPPQLFLENSLDSLLRRGKKKRSAPQLDTFFGENLVTDDDTASTVPLKPGTPDPQVFDLRRTEGLVCELCLWIQPHFAEAFGLGGGLFYGVAEVVDLVRLANWVFRALDFNEDNYPENIGFKIKRVLLSDKIVVDRTGRWKRERHRDYFWEGPGDSLAQLAKRFEEIDEDLEESVTRWKRRVVDDLSAYDYADDPSPDYASKSRREETKESLKNYSKSIKVLPAKTVLQNVASQLRDQLPDCCGILAFLYHDLRPTFTAATKRGLCSDKNVGVISGLLNSHKIGKFDVFRGVMHTLGHLFGASHDALLEPDCVDTQLRNFLNPFPLHPITQLNVGLRPNSFQFSSCAKEQITTFLLSEGAACLKPAFGDEGFCGNGILDEGEECDCGSPFHCQRVNPCGERDSSAACKILPSARKKVLPPFHEKFWRRSL